jgi:hypothetical protein
MSSRSVVSGKTSIDFLRLEAGRRRKIRRGEDFFPAQLPNARLPKQALIAFLATL